MIWVTDAGKSLTGVCCFCPLRQINCPLSALSEKTLPFGRVILEVRLDLLGRADPVWLSLKRKDGKIGYGTFQSYIARN